MQANLTIESDVDRMFREDLAKSVFGPVHIAIVNHGYFHEQATLLKDMSLSRWNDTIERNLTSVFLVVRGYMRQLEAAPDDVKDKAALTLIGSTSGKVGEAYHADYSAAKSGELLMLLQGRSEDRPQR